jgi:hypothetical protein
MGLIQSQSQPKDRRPRDWIYAASFNKKDLPSLEEMARHIRETHDIAMIEDFNAKCEQRLSGEKAVLDNGIEIQQVTKSGDLVLTAGLRHCINIILGQTSALWTHFGFGGGSGPAPAITDIALNAETIATRVTLAWSEPVGMRLYFGGITGQSDGSMPVGFQETGVYNGSAAGAILLNRSQFIANAPVQQSTGFSVYSAPNFVSAVIEFCPVA